jgi:hypothetical protein
LLRFPKFKKKCRQRTNFADNISDIQSNVTTLLRDIPESAFQSISGSGTSPHGVHSIPKATTDASA